jgi:type IV pilus secretin PilQ/predicted competence protein
MFEMPTKISLAPILLALIMQFGCSGDKPQSEVEEPVQVDDDVGLEGGNSKNEAAKNQAANGSAGNTEEGGGGNEVAEEKTPISEDGYDDDWNNLNSQQQKANNNKNNKKNQVAEEENPPLQNAAPEQNVPENPPIQNVANQPTEQIYAEEPAIDQEPAPVPEQLAQVVEEPVAPPPTPVAPPASIAPVVSGAPLIKQDAEPVFSQLFWVGYDYLEKDSLVRLEIVTRGSPRYNLFQERNKSDQPELVLRFFNTRLRPKVRRDIDASQFRSPVAYVRMRADEIENSVDVIITMRDAVRPRMYSKYGNILLTFPIPDHYFGNAAIGSAPIAKAEVLANANIMPELDTDSEIPEGLKIAKAFVNNPGKDALGSVPSDAGEPIDTGALPVSNGVTPTNAELPADFVNTQIPVQEENISLPNQNAGNNFSQDAGLGNQQANLTNENVNANEDAEESDLSQDAEGQANQGTDDFDFGATQPVNAQQGANNFSEEELNGNAAPVEEENTGDELDEDSLNNFEDDGEGSQEDIDKFDVKNKNRVGSPGLLVAGFIVTQMSINAVAQDDFGNEEGGDLENAAQGQQVQAQNQAQGNVAANSNIQNGSLGNNQNAGQNTNTGNFEAESENGETGDEDFLGEEGAQGNNTGGNNFGNTTTNNAFPTNTGNPVNTGTGNANPANTFVPVNNTAVTNTTMTNSTVPVNEGVAAGEPAIDSNPDLAGPETEGSESENPVEGSAGGRKIKLDFRGAPLREVIRVLSEESGVNFVYAPAVENLPIHISLSDIPFNDALKALLSSHSLGMVEIGPNIVKIDSLAAIAAENRAIEERRSAELRIRPTKILVHRLSYAKAEQVATTLEPMLKAAAVNDPRVNIQRDVRSNSVIVNAVPEILAVAKSLLERLDLETPQVKIASRIVEIIKTNADRIGISWGTPFNLDQGRGLGFGNLVFPNYMLSRYTVDAGGTAPAPGNMQFRLGSMNNTMALDLALSLEEAIGTTEILQSNDITVDDNTEAIITAGRSDFLAPTMFANAQGEAIIPEIKYDLGLTVTPQITGDGAVQMSLKIESEDPTPPASPAAQAASNRKTVSTKLLRRSGETAVIAGVYNSNVQKSKTGVPFFSKIPIIGALFRSSNESETKRELLIMVTPTILPSIGKGSSGGGDEPVSVSLNATGNGNLNSQNGNNFNANNQNQNNSFGNNQNQNANNNQEDSQFSNQAGNQANSGNQANAGNQVNAGNQNNNFGNQGNNAGNQQTNPSNNQNSNQQGANQGNFQNSQQQDETEE